jgi:integrase
MREKNPGVWELRVYLGRDWRGRPIQKSRTVRGGKREAKRALDRLAAEYEPLRDLPTSDMKLVSAPGWGADMTINQAIRAWRDNGWEDLSPTTTERYEQIWRTYVFNRIGRRKIASLSPYDVEQFFRQLKREGVGFRTVQQLRSVLHRACRLARKWSGNQLPNPVADTELPEWPFDRRGQPVRAPSAKEVRAIITAAGAYDRRVGAFVRLTAATGARRGELCALRWSDIDWDDRTVHIDAAVVAAPGGRLVKGPKTRASVRRIAVDDGTLSELHELLVERQAIAADCGVTVRDESFIFSTEPSGATPPHPEPLTHMFRRLRALANVRPDIHLHSLRHFQATALDPVVSEAQKQARLGWSTVHMARHYTDAINDEDRRAAEHIGEMLGEPLKASSPSQTPSRRSAVRFYRPGAAETTSASSSRSTARRGI